MLTKIQKWGNSLALRIPKAFAVDAHLEQDSPVEIHLVDDKIVITPLPTPQWTLEKLLVGISADNLHAETDTGPAAGSETW